MGFTPALEYNLIIQSPKGQAEIVLGQEDGWIDTYRRLLDTATRLSLSPRNDSLPFVSVALEGKRWIYFSRVCGKMGTERRARLYAIGWQDTVNGKNVKCILWIYPDGTIECAEEPSFVERFNG